MQNFLSKEIEKNYTKETLIDNFSKILITMLPIIPHFASECLELLKVKVSKWPEYNEELLIEDIIPYVIQINGKKRGLIETKRDISEEELIDIIIKEKNISKYFSEKKIKNCIYIKNKLLNIIV